MRTDAAGLCITGHTSYFIALDALHGCMERPRAKAAFRRSASVWTNTADLAGTPRTRNAFAFRALISHCKRPRAQLAFFPALDRTPPPMRSVGGSALGAAIALWLGGCRHLKLRREIGDKAQRARWSQTGLFEKSVPRSTHASAALCASPVPFRIRVDGHNGFCS